MKQFFVLMLFLVVMSTAAFALDNNFGFGALYNNASTYGQWKHRWYDEGGYYYDTDWSLQRNGFGAFMFLGLSRFFELNLGIIYKHPYNIKEKDSDGDNWDYDPSEYGWTSVLAGQVGFYFKYPLPISEKLILFPTVGVDGEISLYSLEHGEFLPEDWWHDIWFRGGVGMDFFFTEKVFLRTHAIYGLALPVLGDPRDNLSLSHGLLVKLGVGWMF
jgi:hypothetical protein